MLENFSVLYMNLNSELDVLLSKLGPTGSSLFCVSSFETGWTSREEIGFSAFELKCTEILHLRSTMTLLLLLGNVLTTKLPQTPTTSAAHLV